MKASCSSCEAEIEADSPRCPVCMHERTRAEIFQSLRGIDAVKSSRRAAALKGAFLMLLGVGGTVFGIRWAMTNRVVAVDSERAHREKVKRDAEEIRLKEEARQRRMLPSTQDPEAGTSEEDDGEAPRKTSTVKDWSVRGEVYDLKTLAPVAAAKVSFTPDGGQKARRVSTGADGRFTLSLPKAEAPYIISVTHPKYDGTFIEDGSPPYRRQTKELRLDALQTLRSAKLFNVPLSPPEEDDAVELAFVLLPD